MTDPVASTRHPSVAARAIIAAALFGLFFLITAGLGAVLILLPFGYVWLLWRAHRSMEAEGPLLFFFSWSTAGVLFATLRRLFRSPGGLPGRVLAREEAAGLFDLVQSLARATRTAPPDEIRLTPGVQLAVVELRGRRVLLVGAPVLWRAPIDELRAGLAHEMGHFAFGSARFGRVRGAVGALFQSAVETATHPHTQSPFMGPAVRVLGALVTRYVRLYLAAIRPYDRRMELAADELAVRLVGAAPLGALLRRMSVEGPLYDQFFERHVSRAVSAGAFPTDLLRVFDAFLEHPAHAAEIAAAEEAARVATTDPFDAHPAVPERLAAAARVETTLAAGAPALRDEATTSSRALVAFDVDSAAGDLVAVGIGEALPGRAPPTRVPFAALAPNVYAPLVRRVALEMAAALTTAHPRARFVTEHFAEVVAALQNGQLEAMAVHLEPHIARMGWPARGTAILDVGTEVTTRLFFGALLERGAELQADIGESELACVWQGSRVLPRTLARASMNDAGAAEELSRWAAMLAGVTPSAAGGGGSLPA